MTNSNVIAIDLAKDVFEVCIVSKAGKVLTRKTLSRKELLKFMAKQKQATVAIEACGGSHYWARRFTEWGHDIMIIPTKVVTPYRQGQKTDRNDALAIAEAASRPEIRTVAMKSIDQQSLQSMLRIREHLSQALTSTSNMIRGLLMEFGITFRKGFASLKKQIPLVLEDAENEFPMPFRHELNRVWQYWQTLEKTLQDSDKQLRGQANTIEPCKRLQEIEGIGPVNAIILFVLLGDGSGFRNGREASAYIGATPKQHSSGGKVVLLGISKHTGHRKERSSLIQGARSVVHKSCCGDTAKGKWLRGVIERSGHGKASVALVNKNIRQAWAVLSSGEAYDTEKTTAKAA